MSRISSGDWVFSSPRFQFSASSWAKRAMSSRQYSLRSGPRSPPSSDSGTRPDSPRVPRRLSSISFSCSLKCRYSPGRWRGRRRCPTGRASSSRSGACRRARRTARRRRRRRRRCRAGRRRRCSPCRPGSSARRSGLCPCRPSTSGRLAASRGRAAAQVLSPAGAASPARGLRALVRPRAVEVGIGQQVFRRVGPGLEEILAAAGEPQVVLADVLQAAPARKSRPVLSVGRNGEACPSGRRSGATGSPAASLTATCLPFTNDT